MRRKVMGLLAAMAVLLVSSAGAQEKQGKQGKQEPPGPPPGMKLTSTGWPDAGEMAKPYTCLNDPSPTAPGLSWTKPPAGTASYAVLLHDPDFTRDKGTTDILLWMVWNIPGSSLQLSEGMKEGFEQSNGIRQGKNVRGEVVYRGPCASGNPHHFTLELFALDKTLELPADTTRPDLLKAMEGHVLGKAITIGLFHR